MNRKQVSTIWAGILIMVVMGIYPPWTDMVELQGTKSELPSGYAWLFDDNPSMSQIWVPAGAAYEAFGPALQSKTRRVGAGNADYALMNATGKRIDFMRLLIQWVCVSLLTCGFLLSLSRKQTEKEGGD